jgi:hypothetical protein
MFARNSGAINVWTPRLTDPRSGELSAILIFMAAAAPNFPTHQIGLEHRDRIQTPRGRV